MYRKNVVIGFVGTNLDSGKKNRWRPSVAITQHVDFPIERLELLYDKRYSRLAHGIKNEIESEQAATEVILHLVDITDPWDFQQVYGALFDFARDYGFDEERENYHVHLTTGTHVAQICWFLLTESLHIPARLLQSSPPRNSDAGTEGHINIIDLDLSQYDALQQRFAVVRREYNALLKAGIETRNRDFNAMIERIELVATTSIAPVLLQGRTGTGKSALARRIFELKHDRRKVKGQFVHVNCSTLKGEGAMSALFGHRKGAVARTVSDRKGLLQKANGGVLFLDEVDELGLDEQAMVLHALETGTYYPMGSDFEQKADFQLIVGANRDLGQMVSQGQFRADLFARLNLWTFTLPNLADRREDIEPNIEYELAKAEKALGTRVGFNLDAHSLYLRFATDPATPWPGNFRDLSASIQRLCTLAPRARITLPMVEEEISFMSRQWSLASQDPDEQLVRSLLGKKADAIDRFDLVQLACVIRTCQQSKSLSAAGRTLFAASRATKASRNDADRLRKYLEKFSLNWGDINA